METFSALLCAGNSLVTGEYPTQRPLTKSFGVFFDLRLNKRLSKQSRRHWFETPSRSLWRHSNGIASIPSWHSGSALLNLDSVLLWWQNHFNGSNSRMTGCLGWGVKVVIVHFADTQIQIYITRASRINICLFDIGVFISTPLSMNTVLNCKSNSLWWYHVINYILPSLAHIQNSSHI